MKARTLRKAVVVTLPFWSISLAACGEADGSPAQGAGAGASGASAGAGGAGAAGMCPTTLPSMNDPCPSPGLVCKYPTMSGCGTQLSCTDRWSITHTSDNGVCNPPATCPTAEPMLDEWYLPNTAGSPLLDVCRYPHGTCFSYWNAVTKPGATGWSMEPVSGGPADNCCTTTPPAAASACPGLGATCVYGDEAATCAEGGWVFGPKPPVGP